MAFIGISLGYNTSVALVDPQEGVKLAISEERLTREKNTKKFPVNALRKCVEAAKKQINGVAMWPDEINIGISSYEIINDRTMKYIDDKDGLRGHYDDFYSFLEDYVRKECNIPQGIKMVIKRVNHHEAHMLPAYYMSGFANLKNTPVTVTADGFGDGVSLTITNNRTNEVLAREPIQTSIGLVYQYVTGALGYTEHKHEGKITSLAAFGQFDPKYNHDLSHAFDSIISFDIYSMQFVPKYTLSTKINYETNKNIKGFNDMVRLREAVYGKVAELLGKGYSKEGIARAVQDYAERMITSIILFTLDANRIVNPNIALSGGLFNNVNINSKIYNMGVNSLYVYPPTGDEGTSIGSAIDVMIKAVGENSIYNRAFSKTNLYLSGQLKTKHIDLSIVDKNKYKVYASGTVEVVNRLAEMLRDGKVICISNDNNEFGARALGNSSVVFGADSRVVGDRVSKALERESYMPFAPVTTDELSCNLFDIGHGLEQPIKYMAINLEADDQFKVKYPVACHIDGTVRLQSLSEDDNEFLYNLIDRYHSLTGNEVVINTSFNPHGVPMIIEEDEAYRTFDKLGFDALVIDDLLIVRNERGALND